MTTTIITLFVLAGAPAPVIGNNHKLACPEGTAQFGAPRQGKLACSEGLRNGVQVFHGPVISFFASGKVDAVGQAEHGMRSGKWSFYDEAGVLVGETEFKNGDFHGRRVFYFADGRIKSEERWVNGVQQGLASANVPGGTVTTPR
ncbi:MAG: hypothetical protein JNK82_12170 [Myxococcaceae bacterium]|nr:hypothetical protein [Myxococcaceae bacterium]